MMLLTSCTNWNRSINVKNDWLDSSKHSFLSLSYNNVRNTVSILVQLLFYLFLSLFLSILYLYTPYPIFYASYIILYTSHCVSMLLQLTHAQVYHTMYSKMPSMPQAIVDLSPTLNHGLLCSFIIFLLYS